MRRVLELADLCQRRRDAGALPCRRRWRRGGDRRLVYRTRMSGSRRAMRGIVAAGAVGAALAGWTSAAQATTVNFSPTGAEQVFTVPSGVTTLQVVAIGARGGTGAGATSGGGFGGLVTGDVAVSPGQSIYVEVGGNCANGETGNAGAGGFNGGGAGGNSGDLTFGNGGGGGGGASDIRTASLSGGVSSLSTRIIIAAGGGGSGGGASGGEGGEADPGSSGDGAAGGGV